MARELDRDPESPLVDVLAQPEFYPHRPERVETVETHISWLFLAGDLVYKVRKPVVLPFLDYGTLEKRRRMCEEEVRLGRRLAADLYLGVRSVVRGDSGYKLGERNDPGAVEYVVEERRFAEDRTLHRLLERGEAGPDQIDSVATLLAEFHTSAERAPAAAFGLSAVAAVVDENFETLLELAPPDLAGALAAAHRFATAFIHGRRQEIAGRQSGGHVRDCHGDLRAEHVILDGRGEIFDPVEFDPALRLIDVSADLAFLVMDLEAVDRGDLARELRDAYLAAGGDYGSQGLLYFYAAYRAWVRAKVAFVRAAELRDAGAARDAATADGRRHAAVGRRLAWRARSPLVLVISGTSASGKTHLARELARLSGFPHLQSDVVRKELAGLNPTTRAPRREYAEEASLRTYAELGARATAAVRASGGVILDATFRRRRHRDAFSESYEAEAEPRFLECRAPGAVLARRAATRMHESTRVSDATADIVARQRREFQELDEIPPCRHRILRTDRTVEAMVAEVEAVLDEWLVAPGG